MSDLISRQAAIEALNEVVKDHSITDFDAIASILDLPPAQPEPCEDAVSRQAAIDGLNDAVHEHNITDFDAVATILALPSVTPKRRTGKWILDRSGAYCCSECMEPCASYVMMKPRDKFCKMCGSRNEVKE